MSQKQNEQKQEKHIFNDEGKPFDSVEEVLEKIAEDELDGRVFVPQKYRNGYVILNLKVLSQGVAQEETGEAKKGVKKERYVRVQFNQKGHKNDLNHVPLTVNGNELRAPRGKPTVLPLSYVEVADHAVQSSWEPSENPEQAAIPGPPVQRYPFTVIDDDVPFEEFQKELAEGNEQTRAALKTAHKK